MDAKRVEQVMRNVPGISDEVAAEMIQQEMDRRKRRVAVEGVMGYSAVESSRKDVNKQFLVSTIRDVNGHNRRVEESKCWNRRKREGEFSSREEDRKRASDSSTREYWAERKAKKRREHEEEFGSQLAQVKSIDEAPEFETREKRVKKAKKKEKKRSKKKKKKKRRQI